MQRRCQCVIDSPLLLLLRCGWLLCAWRSRAYQHNVQAILRSTRHFSERNGINWRYIYTYLHSSDRWVQYATAAYVRFVPVVLLAVLAGVTQLNVLLCFVRDLTALCVCLRIRNICDRSSENHIHVTFSYVKVIGQGQGHGSRNVTKCTHDGAIDQCCTVRLSAVLSRLLVSHAAEALLLLARDAPLRTNCRAIAMMFVCLFVGLWRACIVIIRCTVARI